MLNFDAFLSSLPIMMYGMGGIFIVIGVIVICTKLLCKAFPPKA